MKIVDVTVQRFRYRSKIVRDSQGHSHPGPEQDASQSLLTIVTDEGIKGTCIGGIAQATLENTVKPILIGEDPFYRERIWQALKERQRLRMLLPTSCERLYLSLQEPHDFINALQEATSIDAPAEPVAAAPTARKRRRKKKSG